MWQAVSTWWKLSTRWKLNIWWKLNTRCKQSKQHVFATLVMLVLLSLVNASPSLSSPSPANRATLQTATLQTAISQIATPPAMLHASNPTYASSMRLLAGYAYAQETAQTPQANPQATPQENPQTLTAPWVSALTGLVVTTLIVFLGVVAGRSVYLVRRELKLLHEVLADTQRKRHDLEHTLSKQTRKRHALQQALEHVSDGVYHLNGQGQLLDVISNNPAKTPTYDLHDLQVSNSGLSLEGLFPHKLACEVRKLLEQTREHQTPQQHHYQHHPNVAHQPTTKHYQTKHYQTKHYQLHCFPVDVSSDKNTLQPNGFQPDDTSQPLASEYLLVVRDISEQVALQTSEQCSKAVLAAIPQAIGRFSRSGHYLEIVNPGSFAQVLSREQLEGKHMLDYLPYAVAKKMQHHIDTLYATGRGQSFFYHLNSDSGKRVYRHAHLALLGEREHVAIVRDVTEQVRVERALEQSEARFREIAVTVDAVFFVFDLVSQHFRYVSPKFDQIVGVSRQLLYDFTDVETTFSRLIYPADWPAFEEAFTNMSRGQEVILEYRLQHPSTGLRWLRTQVSRGNAVEQRLNSYQDDLDSAVTDQHMIGITTDITERKHAEDALSASETRMRAILHALPDGIGRFSRQGRYLEVLHQGYYTPIASTQDLIGKSIAEVLPAEAAQRALYHLQRVFEGSELEAFEYDVLIHDKTHHRETYLVPFDNDSCIGVVHDITERKRVEHALSHALTEKTALLNEIHHRVKNNLQVIASLLTLHARATDDLAVKDALEANRKRVIAMATVHKLIYTSGSLSEVAFHNYLHAIVPNLLPPHSMNRVQVHFALTPLLLPIDYAIPLGIITAELLENIFHHAFAELHQPSSNYHHAAPEHGNAKHHDSEPHNAEYHNHETQTAPTSPEVGSTAIMSPMPTVTIALEQHQHVTLRVSDNGVGLPETFDGDNLDRHTSLGISVVDALVSQIGGSWRISRLQPGTQVDISFVVTGETLE